ncbi:hypothetical protein PBAL39_02392 [Pedobacter sp. BAL39]|uniref:T9SS C-terminal target domain-containing protein n=1 Tax=Pedobacter sp. BAL39 TaxID=391596 RepID=UPI000155A0B9|nr:T9SS C-terminal target domain-containing protein [Pedobacter sp. BAL39]EDM38427.1 hypothetical protein PBAL39_02392 [Pedobacter sp. BAL39]
MKLIKACSIFIFLLFFCYNLADAQICGTPGLDGPANTNVSINSYFPVAGTFILNAGSVAVPLAAVPADDPYGNNFGTKAIQKGDLLLIIQMQDAQIAYSNDNRYGANNASSGPDGLGGTGFTSLGNTGVFEYVIATSDVPLTGGALTFKGVNPMGNSAVNSYYNEPPTATRGKRTFQVIRVPQYSNLILSNDVKTPPFNGIAGGVIAFDVSGTMDFNGHVVDASARGFRGGYAPRGESGLNIDYLYVKPSNDPRGTGKGEGIAGTPRYMWDGFNLVDNIVEGLPDGSVGKGAPANAGGGGNDHNAGGGGGANAGFGGVGGNGVRYSDENHLFPNGGRPGSLLYRGLQDLNRLIMGGGGGGGDANDALDGVKGGVGGGIVLINAGSIKGRGTILSNGSKGQVGLAGAAPDGAGGGGAGGTVFIKVNSPDPASHLNIQAMGGAGGNTERDRDPGQEHGPGGGGGGGQVFYATPASTVTVDVRPGSAGVSAQNTPHNAAGGTTGRSDFFALSDLPPYLQGSGSGCYPELNTVMAFVNNGSPVVRGSILSYSIIARNVPGGGNAGGVQVEAKLPSGFAFQSAIATYTGNAGGPSTVLVNLSNDDNRPRVGDFNISPGDEVRLTMYVRVDCMVSPGTYDAHAQSLFLDPTRTLSQPQRRITPLLNAFAGSNTNYETGSRATIPGTNFSGTASAAEDVTINDIVISNNMITAPQLSKFCAEGDPDVITGSTATGGFSSLSYQWQASANGVDYLDIAAANASDYDPGVLNVSTYFRRQVVHLGCAYSVASDPVYIEIEQTKAVLAFEPIPDQCASGAPYRLREGRETAGVVTGGTETYSGTGVDANGYFNPAVAGIGTFTITYTYQPLEGCPATATQTVAVYPLASSDAGPDVTILEDGQVQLEGRSNGSGLTYKWSPATGLSRDDISNPVARPKEDIVYTLTVTSMGGCISTARVKVTVLKNPEIPNAFSPNGDNINDTWNITYLESYPDATIDVFNRYGEKVFSASGAAAVKSWDGRYKGNDLPVGTYYYLVNPRNGRKSISGAVTIIR